MATEAVEISDVQGIAFYGYGKHPFSRYILVTLARDDPRTFTWLGKLKIRHARDAHDRGERKGTPETTQIAFTASGLVAFGLSLNDLSQFPREFLVGMNDVTHAPTLGDDPGTWEFGGPGQPPIHAVLMLFAPDEETLASFAARHRVGLAEAGARIVHEDEGRILEGSREHFGFHDGISEPYIDGGPRTKKSALTPIPAGELLLGYEDAYEETVPSPLVRGFDFGRNGSFVVYRTMKQRVALFWEQMRTRARPRGGETIQDAAIRLAASMVGRWPGGAPLVKHPHGDPGDKYGDENDFSYAREDPRGHSCPLGAHARRANPRDMLAPNPDESMTEVSRHRLMRRGRPYGPERPERPWTYTDDDGIDRGLVFIALCASLRRQFEFIQQTWLNNPKFAGLYDERDPMLGSAPPPSPNLTPPRLAPFTLQGEPVRRCLVGLPSFIKMRGGAYFFLPGLRAISWLATPRGQAAASIGV
jgi:Dyp-type peroxidase family